MSEDSASLAGRIAGETPLIGIRDGPHSTGPVQFGHCTCAGRKPRRSWPLKRVRWVPAARLAQRPQRAAENTAWRW